MNWNELYFALSTVGTAMMLTALFSSLVYGAIRISQNLFWRESFSAEIPVGALGVFFAFGLLAFATGLIMAASRVAAVGQVVPAILGLIGAVAMYLITKESAKAPLIGGVVCTFTALLLLGTVMGSFERERARLQSIAVEYDLKRLQWQADREFAINVYRKSRGLDPLSFAGD